jgi:hypothetical protein
MGAGESHLEYLLVEGPWEPQKTQTPPRRLICWKPPQEALGYGIAIAIPHCCGAEVSSQLYLSFNLLNNAEDSGGRTDGCCRHVGFVTSSQCPMRYRC